jgi:hypothetical protein
MVKMKKLQVTIPYDLYLWAKTVHVSMSKVLIKELERIQHDDDSNQPKS